MGQRQPNLSIAGRLLLLEIVLGIALMLVLDQVGLPYEWVPVGVWVFNFITAAYLFKAAKALGKRAAFYGLLSAAGPPGSLFSFYSLHTSEALARLDKT